MSVTMGLPVMTRRMNTPRPRFLVHFGRVVDPDWAARLSSDDLRGLSPLIYTHINPYGRFEVDLDRRIDFERKAA